MLTEFSFNFYFNAIKRLNSENLLLKSESITDSFARILLTKDFFLFFPNLRLLCFFHLTNLSLDNYLVGVHRCPGAIVYSTELGG